MIVKLLTEHNLEVLSLTKGYRGSSESRHVKMPHCWKSHATAHLIYLAALTLTPMSYLETKNTVVIYICQLQAKVCARSNG